MTPLLQDLLKHTSRSLYLSARLLPPAVRDSFAVAYLLCRYADTIADTALLPPQKRLYWIEQFPSLVTYPDEQKLNDLVQEIAVQQNLPYEEKLLRQFSACAAAFDQLDSWQRETILWVVHQVCAGMELDLKTFPDEKSGQIGALQTAAELEHYCQLMGGAPGIFWSKLIANTVRLPIAEEDFCKYGQAIGDALQIVNVLRDLPRDIQIGRCYFPAEDLQQCGLSAADLADEKNSPRFEPVKQKWIAWGRKKLEAAYPYMCSLPKTQPAHRAAVAWPVLWAGDTLNKLAQEKNLLSAKVRVKITRRRIYGTMAATGPLLLSNFLFCLWLQCKLFDEK